MKKVFILGNPRSGTTLFRLMLNAHPEIVSPPECGFLHWWYRKYYDWNMNCNNLSKVDEFIADLQTSKKIETWNLNFLKLKDDIIKKKPENYNQLGEIIYAFYGTQKGKTFQVIADKNNYYINYLDDLQKIWQDAKYILIVRDGRDVACSYKNLKTLASNSPYKPTLPTSIKLIAREWLRNNENVSIFFTAIPDDSAIIVRYEDILLNTEVELSKVCSFLNVHFDEKMLDYYISNSQNNDEPQSTIDWKKKTLEKPDKKNIGKYKIELNEYEVKEFNNIAGKLLHKFNYEL